MQFFKKNILASLAVVAMGLGAVSAAPTATLDRTHEVIGKLNAYIKDHDIQHQTFDPAGLRGPNDVTLVTSDKEAEALSEKHAGKIRIEASGNQLIYVLVPDVDKAPTEHIGTLSGAFLDSTLDDLENRLTEEEQTGTTPVPAVGLDSERRRKCTITWCIINWQCYYWDKNCGGCIILWCFGRKD